MTGRCAAIVALSLIAGACARSVPETRYYQLDLGAEPAVGGGGVDMAVEPFTVDATYDDVRIVYRPSPFEVDYYNYHHWASPPGELVADALREGYRRTGQFRTVTSELVDDSGVLLTGRVLALEEVDRARDDWRAVVELELRLLDATTADAIWTRTVRREVRLREQSPAGLARALSVAVWSIVDATSTEIAAAAEQRSDGMRDAISER